jgi:hypothetical protein
VCDYINSPASLSPKFALPRVLEGRLNLALPFSVGRNGGKQNEESGISFWISAVARQSEVKAGAQPV